MNCEVCGREISGKPFIVRIGGAILYACNECAATRKLAIPMASTKKETASREGRPAKKPTYASMSVRPRQQPPELSLKPIDNYGSKIREKREKAGIAIKDLARLVGIKESLLRKIEGGRITPSIADLRKLENAIKVKLVEEAVEEEESSKG